MENKKDNDKVIVKHYTLCFCYIDSDNKVHSFTRCFFSYDDLIDFVLNGGYSIDFYTVKIFVHTDRNISFMSNLTLIPCSLNTIVY